MQTSSLTVLGTGLRAARDTTIEAKECIERASKVLYLVADSGSAAWIEQLNPSAQSLAGLYELGKLRFEIYEITIKEILSWLRRTSALCVAFYGHPGFYAFAGHEAIERARREGFLARMLPGISCQDQMFADLGVDPGASGCPTYEATSFLIHHARLEPTAGLVLLQAGVLGEAGWPPSEDNTRLHVLSEHLAQLYGPDHEVVVYEASFDPDLPARFQRTRLSTLHPVKISVASTLYVPPKGLPEPNFELLKKLGMNPPRRSDPPGVWAREALDH